MADREGAAAERPAVSPSRAFKKLARHVMHHTEDVMAEAFLLSYIEYVPAEGPDLFTIWREL